MIGLATVLLIVVGVLLSALAGFVLGAGAIMRGLAAAGMRAICMSCGAKAWIADSKAFIPERSEWRCPDCAERRFAELLVTAGGGS